MVLFLASTDVVLISFAVAGAVSLGVILYFIFSPTQRAKRRFKKTPLKNIAGCKYHRGAMRITGKLEYINPPITAPMSGRHCAYFEFKVDEKRSSGKNSHWVNIIDHKEGHDFAVIDSSGKAIVNIGLANVLVTKDANNSSGTFNAASNELESVLAGYGHSSKGWIFNKNLRYSEGVLEQGEDVSVSGNFDKHTATDPSTGSSYQQPTFTSTQDYKLVITDNPSLTKYKGSKKQSY